MTKKIQSFPSYLAAIDNLNKRIFVLSTPHLSAIKENGVWKYREPLTDEEINEFELITDLTIALKLVKEAKEELRLP